VLGIAEELKDESFQTMGRLCTNRGRVQASHRERNGLPAQGNRI